MSPMTQQVLRPLLIENRATSRWPEETWKETREGKFALMTTRQYVDARALGGEHQVDAGSTSHLGQTLERVLDVLRQAINHEVGELVDDDHDVGQWAPTPPPPGLPPHRAWA